MKINKIKITYVSINFLVVISVFSFLLHVLFFKDYELINKEYAKKMEKLCLVLHENSNICKTITVIKEMNKNCQLPNQNSSFCDEFISNSKTEMQTYHEINSKSKLFFSIISILILFIYLIANKDLLHFIIIKYYKLNSKEEFLFKWIADLKKSGFITSKVKFNLWMTNFESRYTERELTIMKLNFEKMPWIIKE